MRLKPSPNACLGKSPISETTSSSRSGYSPFFQGHPRYRSIRACRLMSANIIMNDVNANLQGVLVAIYTVFESFDNYAECLRSTKAYQDSPGLTGPRLFMADMLQKYVTSGLLKIGADDARYAKLRDAAADLQKLFALLAAPSFSRHGSPLSGSAMRVGPPVRKESASIG